VRIGCRLPLRHHLPQHLGQIARSRLELELVLLAGGQQQQLVDQPQQPARIALDAADVRAAGTNRFRAHARTQLRRRQQHQRQRSANLVVDVGKDAIARLLGLSQAAHRLRQRIARL